MHPPERKYAMTKLAAGDYLLPSNDGMKLWRIAFYIDAWELWLWLGPSVALLNGDASGFKLVDLDDWSNWKMTASTLPTRADAIRKAMTIGG